MSKKLVFLVIIILLSGVAIGLLSSSYLVEADIFEDISSFFKKGLEISTPEEVSAPEEEVQTEEKAPIYKPVVAYENAVVAAVQAANPSVVSVIVSKDLPIIERCAVDPFGNLSPNARDFFGRDFGFGFYEPCQKGTEKKEVGGGSGFIVSEDGLIVTNKHVVLDKDAEYTVLTNNGEKYDAKVIARDPIQDIAILKIDATGLSPVKLGDSDSLKLGQTAIAIGNALGEFRNTVSVGVISGLARSITASGAGGFVERIEDVIQTDSAINQGNSGGPLLNLWGEVIGVNTAVVIGAQNIGFAIPINRVKRDIKSVKETGTIETPFLGVRYFIITPEFAKEQNLPVDYGVILRGTEGGPAVMEGSAAAKAGLQAEDIILEMDGNKITPENTLGSMIHNRNVGDMVTLKVLRDGEEMIFRATLENRPEL